MNSFVVSFSPHMRYNGRSQRSFPNKLFNGQIQLDSIKTLCWSSCAREHFFTFWNRFFWICPMSGCCREKPWNMPCCSRTTENLLVYSELRLMELRWATLKKTRKYPQSSNIQTDLWFLPAAHCQVKALLWKIYFRFNSFCSYCLLGCCIVSRVSIWKVHKMLLG